MRRPVILTALLLGAVSVCRADYIILIANVGQSGASSPGSGVPGLDGGFLPQPFDPAQTGVPAPNPGTGTEIKARLVSTIAEFSGTSLTRGHVLNFMQGHAPLTIRHRWGSTPVLSEKALSQAGITAVAALHIGPDNKLLPGLGKRYQERHSSTFKGTEKPAADVVLELADWVLSHGLVTQYEEVMTKLGEAHATHPAFLAFQEMQKALTASLPAPTPTGWEARIRETFRQELSEHYTLYHNHPRNDVTEVRSYLEGLEQAFKIYYYWFSRRGLRLAVPTEKQLVVLTYRDVEFTELRELFSGSGPRADGFIVRRQGLIVLSGRRLDPSFEALEQSTASLWQKPEIGNRQDLLSTRRPLRELQDQQARTLALILKVMETRGIQTSTTHNASRQLLFASKLLPRNVHVPEWIQVGMSLLLENPSASPWATVGAPHPTHLPYFQELQKHREKGQLPSPTETLRQVVTDAYFREAAAATDPEQALKLRQKAEASSWALCYFLAFRSFEGLNRYFQEISKMPRDLALDEDALFAAFARAVDAWDSEQGTVNRRKLDYLATRWDDEIARASLEASDLFKAVETARENVEKQIKKGPATSDPALGGVPGVP